MARQKASRLPIRPSDSVKKQTSQGEGDREEDVKAVETRVMDEDGTIWWGAPEIEMGAPDEEVRHPSRAWADEPDSEQEEADTEEDTDNGLGQDGLRPDELKGDDKRKMERKEAKQERIRRN